MRRKKTYHLGHLVSYVLQPCLQALHAGDHIRQLVSDDRLGYERFTKDITLACPLEALLHNPALRPDRRAAHDPPLVIKVGKHY